MSSCIFSRINNYYNNVLNKQWLSQVYGSSKSVRATSLLILFNCSNREIAFPFSLSLSPSHSKLGFPRSTKGQFPLAFVRWLKEFRAMLRLFLFQLIIFHYRAIFQKVPFFPFFIIIIDIFVFFVFFYFFFPPSSSILAVSKYFLKSSFSPSS